ncbi:unnamed protein product [Polarella glacialis]|uniref:Uncharacterized protein n=1 Tax=Polarella glacialis TaxID=89957 RepID=A0A813ECI1_POLGL|nr:unnamed protein product [Polarella glacialis]
MYVQMHNFELWLNLTSNLSLEVSQEEVTTQVTWQSPDQFCRDRSEEGFHCDGKRGGFAVDGRLEARLRRAKTSRQTSERGHKALQQQTLRNPKEWPKYNNNKNKNNNHNNNNNN